MTTLVAKYLAAPTEANARRLVSYMRKHMMANCWANALELGTIKAAEAQIAS